MENLWRKHQVAELIGVSQRTVDRLRDCGILPAIRIRGTVRFQPEAVIAALAKLAKQSSKVGKNCPTFVTSN
jgi:excisionase family DNA binding protein